MALSEEIRFKFGIVSTYFFQRDGNGSIHTLKHPQICIARQVQVALGEQL